MEPLLPLPETSLMTHYDIDDEYPWSLQFLDNVDLDEFSWLDYYDYPVETIDSESVLNVYQRDIRKKNAVVQKRAHQKYCCISGRKTKSGLSEMGMEESRKYFGIPILKAAKEMKVGVTVLNKRRRELGIARWPQELGLSHPQHSSN